MASSSSSPTSLSLSLDSVFSTHRFSIPSTLALHNKNFSIKSLQNTTTNSTNSFLDPITTHRIQTLNHFNYTHPFQHGYLSIQQLNTQNIENTVTLLAESFTESMFSYGGYGYVKLLEFLVKQYVMERRNLVPHNVMLVGFYKEEDYGGNHEGELACTAEVSFDARGANAAPPTPLPPKNCPYICNMTVKKKFRRRGIGRELLKACEELISQMKTIRKVYLHCRMIDTVPFDMYKKAGYNIVETDNILVWLSFQRRKHLMRKDLPPLVNPLWDTSESEDYFFDRIREL